MSRHSFATSTVLLTAGLVAGLFAPEARAVAVEEGVPFSEVMPTRIDYPAGTLGTLIPIELRVRQEGVVHTYEGECQAKLVSQNPPVPRLVCPGLGAVDLDLVEQQPEHVAFVADLRDFQLASATAGELLGAVLAGDDPVINGVRVERHWWWGVLCIAEASDASSCDQKCNAIGYDSSRVATAADHVNNKCLAVCQCLDANGNVVTNFVIDEVSF